MFTCHPCSFESDAVAEFYDHLRRHHADNKTGATASSSDETNVGVIKSEPLESIKEENYVNDDEDVGDDNDEEEDSDPVWHEPVIEIQVPPDQLMRPRRRWRPVQATSVSDNNDDFESFLPLKRGRGRPRKSDLQKFSRLLEDDPSSSNIVKVSRKKQQQQREPKPKKLFPCGQCIKEFQSNCDRQRHITSVHLKLKPFTCDKCAASFGRMGNLKKHIDGVHNNIKRKVARVQCPTCGNDYEPNYLSSHISTVHKGEKFFQCEYCGMEFGLKRSYVKHIKEVHLQLKTHKCETCGTKFARRQHLEAHQKRHQRQKSSATTKESPVTEMNSTKTEEHLST